MSRDQLGLGVIFEVFMIVLPSTQVDHLVIKRKSLSVLYLQIMSAEISAERLSVLKSPFGISAERPLTAERPSFGRKGSFQYTIATIIYSPQQLEPAQDVMILCRKLLFRQKDALSADRY